MISARADLFEVDALCAATGVSRVAQAAPAGVAPSTSPAVATGSPRISRRKLLQRILGGGAFAAASGVYGRQIEPFWVQWHDVPMPIRNLPKSFEGFRITHLTDLHAGEDVPFSYLRHVVDEVKKAKPDLVVVTGDLVNHNLEAVGPISQLLAEIPAQIPTPVIASLGNHDYDVSSAFAGMPTRIADALEAKLVPLGVSLLRNRAMSLDHADGRLWFVGLEDLWSGRFSPQVAFQGVDLSEPIIALSHNPDTAMELDRYGVQWTLSGHTHGGQVRIPGVGALILNIQNHEFQQGHFALPHGNLYVSRGVGFLKQIRVFCRPEVPTFVLHRAEA
jgi:predicted MPP superfamily phosphohydrolase